MALLIEYTSHAEVRAVLGVNDDELTSEVLALPLYTKQLVSDLDDINVSLDAAYKAASALSNAARSAAQQKLVDTVQLFSAYSVSKTLCTSLSLFAPKRITDGRAEVERNTDPFKDVRDGVLANYNALRIKVVAALAAAGTSTAAVSGRTYAVTAGIALDPVTNT